MKGIYKMKIIKGQGYCITYDPETATVTCTGGLRLRGRAEYTPISELLSAVAEEKPETITLCMQGLKKMNSSGIGIFSDFVVKGRALKVSKIIVRGTRRFPWQKKSLGTLQWLMPELKLNIE